MKIYIATQARASFDGECHAVVENEACATEQDALDAIRRMEEDYIREYYDGFDDEEEVLKRIEDARSGSFDHGDGSHVEWYWEEKELEIKI